MIIRILALNFVNIFFTALITALYMLESSPEMQIHETFTSNKYLIFISLIYTAWFCILLYLVLKKYNQNGILDFEELPSDKVFQITNIYYLRNAEPTGIVQIYCGTTWYHYYCDEIDTLEKGESYFKKNGKIYNVIKDE